MLSSSLCTENEINQLVRSFYAKARKDPLLGPIFEAHVTNWEAHFIQMNNFWSGNLLGTNRFSGAPMPKHLAIPNLRPELFEQWLKIFKQTTEELGNQPLQEHVNMLAYRIASRLWAAYQMQHYSGQPLLELKAP
ncbi:MAG: preprotein translocase subunit TatC [Nitrosomonadaceae bacterium]|nr:preprotein translocase subunit TatC [Nitrosomonadaceae bacterium]|tara:strand:- start:1326 stop:1730 length:405 start_codon:yes stop_codon:yes gene_type:complete